VTKLSAVKKVEFVSDRTSYAINLRKLNELEIRKQYQIEITNKFAALENLNDGDGINRAWENSKANFKTSATESLGPYKLMQHKPWFYEESLHFLDQRKQAKMQCVQDPSHSNVENLKNVTRVASWNFRNTQKAYLRAKMMNLKLKVK
jgi:hypothetical protein